MMASDTESPPKSDNKEDQTVSKVTTSDKDNTTKRRTKTGCLTCRKRRIKCDEERPICRNCIKSKRECAGYNQPLIYKQHGQPYAPAMGLSTSSTDYRLTQTQSRPNHIIGVQQPTDTGVFWNKATDWRASTFPVTYGHNVTQESDQSTHWGDSRPHEWYNAIVRDSFSVPTLGSQQATVPELVSAGGNRSGTILTPQTSIGTDTEQPLRTPGSSSTDTRYSSLGFVQSPLAMSFQFTSDGIYPTNIPSVPDEDNEDPDDPWDVDMDSGLRSKQGLHEHFPTSISSDKRSITTEYTSTPSYHGISKEISIRQSLATSSPLSEERSQMVFEHFMLVTGPCMGLFERHDYSSSGPPKMIWTEGLPAMAINHPALAHAILAISAIHMFKLNIGSENVAVKHFMRALRRVGGAVGDPKRRLEVSTLATVLLLGYYEVLAGDHSRWNLHLSGAGKLIMEHNYAGMMRTIRRMQSRKKPETSQPWTQENPMLLRDHARIEDVFPKTLEENDWNVDQKLVSMLTGYEVDYDIQEQPKFEEFGASDFDEKGFADWQVLTELYWWYCKQDIFTSLLSGDPLILPYPQWKFCPPRGPLNNPERANTTIDHLWLILARLTDFGAKDTKRKQRVVESQGGQWMPPLGFLEANKVSAQNHSSSGMRVVPQAVDEASRRPSANEGRARKTKTSGSPSSQLNFYGMMPPAEGPVRMPSSFNMMNAELKGKGVSPPTGAESHETPDLDAQTRHALETHAAITEAFDLFESRLGSEYQPLATSDIQITTPFGPALQYRSHVIATMWTFFTMGRILLRRMHPHSPPAALISAGVNARFTQEYAQSIGRICGGLFAQHNYLLQAGHTDYVLSSAVMEVTFSLLFAAVQYSDPVQRGWTIGKLSEIAQVTGWQTSAAVAAACESMWERAGIMGKGPPYQRTMDRNNSDQRLNGAYAFGRSQLSQTTQMDPIEEHESRFVSHDRNLIDKYASTRTHWALGLLSVEDDLRKMSLKEWDK